MKSRHEKEIWVVVYDSHSGHQITFFDTEQDANEYAKEIEDDETLDRTSDWISIEGCNL